MEKHAVKPAMLSVDESAAYTGLSRSTIYRLMGSGELRSSKIVGRRLISLKALDEMLLGNEIGPDE